MADRDDNWQPATSAPGEMFTIEGRIKATGVMARNLRSDDPRLRRHQWAMARTGLVFVGIALALIAVVAVVQSL